MTSPPTPGNGRVNAQPVIAHVHGLLEQRPDVSMAAVARCAGVAASTVKSLLNDAARDGGEDRAVSRVLADRLLAVGVADLPRPGRRYDGRSVDAAPVAGHVRGLQVRYDGAGLALIARTAGINPSTLTSALADHAHNPARGINRHLAARVLAVTALPAPASPRHAHVTTTGLIRRLQALCALGWTLASISHTGGTTPDPCVTCSALREPPPRNEARS